MRQHLLPLLTLAFCAGCTFDGVTTSVYCDAQQDAPKGFECVDGVWVSESTGEPRDDLDMRQTTPPDASMEPPLTPDMKEPVDVIDMRVTVEPDQGGPTDEPDMRVDEPDMRVDEPDMHVDEPDMRVDEPDMKPTSYCGDGIIDPDEQCDDSNMNAGDGCDADCNEELGWDCSSGTGCVTICGDGVLIAPNEQCDDSNQDAGDGCDTSCQPEQGWVCPIGAAGACDEDCGDGVIVGDEECDDGINDGSPGCQDDCTVTPGWACVGAPSNCTQATQGNGQIDQGEDCDDGNQIDTDGCSLAGAIAPGYICGAPGTACDFVTGATATATTASSHPPPFGGGLFSLGCPAGSFMTGIDGHETMRNGLGRLKAVCHDFTTDPATGSLEWNTSSSTPYSGGNTGTNLGETSCPIDSFVTGFSVRDGWSTDYSVQLVYGLKLECRELSIVDGALERSQPPTVTPRHGSRPAASNRYADDCGVVASGITGYSGASIDRFALLCSEMSWTF